VFQANLNNERRTRAIFQTLKCLHTNQTTKDPFSSFCPLLLPIDFKKKEYVSFLSNLFFFDKYTKTVYFCFRKHFFTLPYIASKSHFKSEATIEAIAIGF
jgi:hypothetical protein